MTDPLAWPLPKWERRTSVSPRRTQLKRPKEDVKMNRTKRSLALTWITSLSLIVSLCCGILVTDNAHAASQGNKDNKRETSLQHRKVDQDLGDRLWCCECGHSEVISS